MAFLMTGVLGGCAILINASGGGASSLTGKPAAAGGAAALLAGKRPRGVVVMTAGRPEVFPVGAAPGLLGMVAAAGPAYFASDSYKSGVVGIVCAKDNIYGGDGEEEDEELTVDYSAFGVKPPGFQKITVLDIVEKMASKTIGMLGEIQAPASFPPREAISLSMEAAGLKGRIQSILDGIGSSAVSSEDVLNILLGAHARIRFLVHPGHNMAAGTFRLPVVIPPGGQVDLDMFNNYGLSILDLPTVLEEKMVIVQIVASTYLTEGAVAEFIKKWN